MADSALERLIQLMAKLPGLGPRSARRAVLQLMKRRETLLLPLADAMAAAAAEIRQCSTCGSLDASDPCGICRDEERDRRLLCVVTDIADLWALERAAFFRGRYHVLSGTLSALDGRGPQQIGLDRLFERVAENAVEEVILALPATVDGQTTAHYIAEALTEPGRLSAPPKVTRLAQGVPLGGELDYLDDGTLTAAFRSRREALQ